MGRMRKYDDLKLETIIKKFEEYITETEIPILSEFSSKAGILRDDLYNYEEFYTLRKKAIDKKEAMLERLALEGKINSTMAIFSLKQLGWKDRPTGIEPIDTVIKVKIADD